MTTICVGLKAHMGWVSAVAVDAGSDSPLPVLAERVDLIDSDDREVIEPYHVAGGWHGLEQGPRPANPEAIVERGRQGQVASAQRRLKAFRQQLASSGLEWTRTVLLVGRGYVHDLEGVLGSHAHIHVAEGEAIRDAVRASMKALEINCVEQDEKSIMDAAAKRLKLDDPDALLKSCKPAGAKSWTKEHRLVALGAWLHARQ